MIEKNRGLVADGPGGGKERLVAGDSKKDLAVAVVRLLHGKLDAIDDEKRELGVLRAVLAKSFAHARWRDVIFSLCLTWPPFVSQVPNEWVKGYRAKRGKL